MGGFRFSVVIPTYQRRELVALAIAALSRSRQAPSFEIIVVIDGSTDGTVDALAGLELEFPFRIVSQANAGAAAARNCGAREAQGELLLFLDDDMEASPDLLAEHDASHRSGASAVVGHLPVHPSSRPGFLTRGLSDWAEERRARLLGEGQVRAGDVLTGQLSVRRDVFLALGGFDEGFTRGGSFGNEDTEFGLRLAEVANVVFNPRAVSRQRYVVSPQTYLRQWGQAGAADVRLARKHPKCAADLFRPGGRTAQQRKFVYQASAIPGLASVAGVIAGALAGGLAGLPTGPGGYGAKAFYAVRDLIYWRGVRKAEARLRRPSATILCYHAIADHSADPLLAGYSVPPDQFEWHLDSLIKRGFRFISGDQFAAHIDKGETLPPRAVLLTFDDCYRDLLTEAAPRLRARGVPALAFAVTGIDSLTNEWDREKGASALDLLDATGLEGVRKSSIEIGAHSRTHHSLLDKGVDLAAETAGAAQDLADMGLPRPRYFAYPYGRVGADAREAVCAAGYAAAFALTPRRFSLADDRLQAPRIEILRSDRGLRFWLKTGWPEIYMWLAASKHRLRAWAVASGGAG
ncbi:MAG: glycosyltransferase [Brevundimonas sp.]|uniref:glycosyltransferase n=1 Tax=Brevundimonas sp. TaxID=1871086 RepID=UPI00391A4859